jgi:hypothetical protein
MEGSRPTQSPTRTCRMHTISGRTRSGNENARGTWALQLRTRQTPNPRQVLLAENRRRRTASMRGMREVQELRSATCHCTFASSPAAFKVTPGDTTGNDNAAMKVLDAKDVATNDGMLDRAGEDEFVAAADGII